MGDDSGEVISGSNSNIPSGVPSETCPSETLLAEDVLVVVKFGLFGCGAETVDGGEMGVVCNRAGDNGGGISMIGVDIYGFVSGSGSGVGSEMVD